MSERVSEREQERAKEKGREEGRGEKRERKSKERKVSKIEELEATHKKQIERSQWYIDGLI